MEETGIPSIVKFVCGALAGVGATLVVYPLDVIKIRMQICGQCDENAKYFGTTNTAMALLQHEGIVGFYNGLSASILRQVLWAGGRIGVFSTLLGFYTKNGNANKITPSLLLKTWFAAISGIFGGFLSLPADVSLTRMALDGRLSEDQRRGYKNVFDAIRRMIKDEGFLTIFRGFVPVMIRAVIVNVVQLVSYASSKEYLLKNNILQDNAVCHVLCSTVSTFCTTTSFLPFDTVKTRLQNMELPKDENPQYENTLDCFYKIVTKEGALSLWTGYLVVMARNAPNYICLFLIYENLIKVYVTLNKIKL